MYDIHVILSNSPGSLGAMGMALGNNGVGLEGGGVFTTPDAGPATIIWRASWRSIFMNLC